MIKSTLLAPQVLVSFTSYHIFLKFVLHNIPITVLTEPVLKVLISSITIKDFL